MVEQEDQAPFSDVYVEDAKAVVGADDAGSLLDDDSLRPFLF